MQPRGGILRENHPFVEAPPSQNPNCLKQRSSSSSRKHKVSKENAPPSDLNTVSDASPSVAGKTLAISGKMRSPLPPRPPSSNSNINNPLKRKLSMETIQENSAVASSDSGVKVIVRMRPPNKDEDDGEVIVQKTSNDSLSIIGQAFTFDSVADTESTQMDIFELVGAPLVENCLAGFNSSVFAYGQTGSGKTYTMWGPANALLEENLSIEQQGLTPRVLERLFARINEEQIKQADKQLKYQCRCSFLEIYNEQITDLLNPNQRNLQIREDVKSGVYVENLTEECVSTMKDVTQILIKGLSNRRTGATSINSESSRSHSVFTCVVESRCKSMSDGLSSFKTSRINLVDLAGSERQKLTGAAGERLKEAGNINRSLSQLGNLINILAEVSQTGKQRHIPYRDSRLTFLLQDSLGGNAKLAMVCAISPAQSCKSETLSTLRFAQRAKAIKNKAVVNEVMQDDVNFLRGVIRQLKDELLRMKANGVSADSNGGYSTGWNARRSLNLLKFSLNRPMTLPHSDNDSDEEMEIDEEAVEKLCVQVGLQSTVNEEIKTVNKNKLENDLQSDTDVNMDEGMSPQQVEREGNCEQNFDKPLSGDSSTCKPATSNPPQPVLELTPGGSADVEVPTNLNILPHEGSPVLKSPTLSVSPRVNTSSRKSLKTSSMLTASQKDLTPLSFSRNTSKSQTTDHLAASLHRGLEILDGHRNNPNPRLSSFRFSFRTPADFNSCLAVEKVDVGVQTIFQDNLAVEEEEDLNAVLCSNCKSRIETEIKVANESSSNLQLVPVDGSQSIEKSKKQVPKAVKKVLAEAIRREMALEEFCAKQTSEIRQLNRLVQQYKHERECNAIIGQTREDKIMRLQRLMDGILPTEEFMEEEFASLTHEHKVLKEKYAHHPEVLRTEIELKRVQDELEQYRNFFDMGERDVLVEEIQDLRSQLQFYIDAAPIPSWKENPLLQLTYSCEQNLTPSPHLSTIPELKEETAEEKLEQERIRWTEEESKWISLCEELRMDLESTRSVSEKRKQELDSERQCSEELKEAMQMAMEGHARMLEQYADLEEKHIQLLARHRTLQDGIDDVKKAAIRAGVKGAESKFINALAAEISALKVEREKERRYLRDENKGLQAQLRDTAEAVQAAGELLVRLKEAEEAVAAAEKRATEAEQETERAYKQIEKLKKKHEKDSNTLNQFYAESPTCQEPLRPTSDDSQMVKYDVGEPRTSTDDHQWKEEFEPFYNGEDSLSKLTEQSSWFSGYDRCNI